MTNEFFICACCSFEHQMSFWSMDEENYNELYVNIHLINRKGFFKRLAYGVKYIFGHTSNYGAWDEFIFSTEAENRLYEILKKRQIK